ncbi:MAG TPA: enoyl-CoA hydratase-related protein, partial [Desulfuromonadales bacterium]|nr:enoyl-CoA hydratase-related protein [Desulfuromonadales bacterium]
MTGSILNQLLPREQEFGPFTDPAAGTGDAWTCWRMARDEDGVAWLLFDVPDAKVNVLSETALTELGEILFQLEDHLPQGLVLRSAKASGFCVGADINEFQDMKDREQVIEKLEDAHAVADRLAALACPTLAVIHGPCLGGGLEVALCCDYRLALPDAKLGLPEILLGLHP